MLNPDMILIGESDPRSGELLEELYKGVCDSNPRIQRMNYVNAELTKLSVNTFVTTKISYANMLAQVCETPAGRGCRRRHVGHRLRYPHRVEVSEGRAGLRRSVFPAR